MVGYKCHKTKDKRLEINAMNLVLIRIIVGEKYNNFQTTPVGEKLWWSFMRCWALNSSRQDVVGGIGRTLLRGILDAGA